MGHVKHYEDLRAYQKAFELALSVHKRSLDFPKIEQFAMADQMRRASKSICANIAEGYAKQTQSAKEFHRYLTMAIGSANEMVVWTNFAYKSGYINDSDAENWKDGFDHIARMLNKLKNVQKKI